jgi:heme-degrading monooxygenase HmoA
MIARTWKGRVPVAKSEEYLDYVTRTGIEAQTSTEGNRGSYLLRRVKGDVAEFVVLSLWDSMDAIRRFAGDDPERAVYYPEDERFLLEMTPDVEHWEVFPSKTA